MTLEEMGANLARSLMDIATKKLEVAAELAVECADEAADAAGTSPFDAGE